MRFVIAVHGGAGIHSRESESTINNTMRRACHKAAEILKSGKGTAIDAVEGAIRCLEDDESLNAGYGSNLTINKQVECDASIMEGSGAYGSVGAIKGIKNPVSAARGVLERARRGRQVLGRIPPLLVCGESAVDYVLDSVRPENTTMFGIPEVVPVESMISPRAEREWSYWAERYHQAQTIPVEEETMSGGSTVGAIIICDNGDAAAGVSSGGFLIKYPGRVGQAATFGVGCWADCQRAASGAVNGVVCSVSGTGEELIRGAVARSIGSAAHPLECGDPVGSMTEEFQKFIDQRHQEAQGSFQHQTIKAGTIALISEEKENGRSLVHFIVAFNTPSMAIATLTSEDHEAEADVYRNNNRHSRDEEEHISSSLITSFVSSTQIA